MPAVILQWPSKVPKSEYSQEFLQGMLDRMAHSFYIYGRLADGFPDKVNALASSKARVKKYRKTRNREWLMDAANFLMAEFTHPSLPNTHYRPTSAEESPGRAWKKQKDLSKRANNGL
jgi:hypothetical protein